MKEKKNVAGFFLCDKFRITQAIDTYIVSPAAKW